MVVAKGICGIDQDDVEVAVQLTVLKSIVHDQHFDVVFPRDFPGCRYSGGVLFVRNARAKSFENPLFVIRLSIHGSVSSADDCRS